MGRVLEARRYPEQARMNDTEFMVQYVVMDDELAQAFKMLGDEWLRRGRVETDEEAAERVYNKAVKEYERTL